MNSIHPNTRHPPFTGPWAPHHPYPPPRGFPNNHRFYPPPYFQHPSVNNQFNPPCSPRLFPELNNARHSYPNRLPGIFPSRPPNPQSISMCHTVQVGNITSDMLPFDQCLEDRFSRNPAINVGYSDHSNGQTCYKDQKPSQKVKLLNSYDHETNSKETLYRELFINQEQLDYPSQEEHINVHFTYNSQFRESDYRESYIYSDEESKESWLSNKQNMKKCENNKDRSCKKSNSHDRKTSSETSNIERQRSRNPDNESKRSRNISKESERKKYPCSATNNLENCSHGKQKSGNHNHKSKQSRNRNNERKSVRNSSCDRDDSKNCSHERKTSKNCSHERKTPKNPNNEGKQTRNCSHEEKKSRNSSTEKKKSKDCTNDVEKSRNDRKGSNNFKNEIEQARNVKNEKEKSRNINNEKKTKNVNDEKEKARNDEREQSETTNHKRKRERNCSKERDNVNSSSKSKKLRKASKERRMLNSSERKDQKEKDKSSPQRNRHKNSNQSQGKSHSSHSSQSHNKKITRIAENNTDNFKLGKGDKQTNAETEEANSAATKYTWIRSSPADLYYVRDENNLKVMTASQKLKDLHQAFESELIKQAEQIKASKPKYEPPQRKTKLRKPKPAKMENEESSSTSEESSSEEEDTSLEELERKKRHPYRLHEELWYNDPGEMNDGPLCRCSAKARRSGIRHGIYAGESSISLCDQYSNNADKLHHYRISITPTTNFVSDTPTAIHHDGHDFTFEGFSILSHFEIPELPHCKVIRFNIEYTILYAKEKFPENFTIVGLELLSHYLFTELLELVDLNWKAHDDSTGCHRFHLLPRFARDIEANGKELLSLNVILQYLLDSNRLLIDSQNLSLIMSLSKHKWQDQADSVKGMIVTRPGMKPSSIRVDQLDRENCDPKQNVYPEIVHFGVRPPQLSYAGNPNYQKAWRDYVKFRHLLANKPKVIYSDRHRLLHKERRLQEMRMKNNLKRDVTVVISSENFYKTGIMCDVVQHAMLLPVLICHLRFHQSLDVLEERIGYKFKDRYLLQLALTHPSYRENFGTNPDHARNSLTNCGIRQPEYGDRRIHYMNTRKRGINTLINIMSRFGRREETASRINHNERLEFLGDAVVEFLSSIHLFFMFSNLEEGGLATYRAAIVQNQHLAVLAKNLQLEKFMLYAHGSDLCHDLELRHAMANCFEALMGALFLDGGIDVADRVFSETLFADIYLEEWINYPLHPLQELEPCGDRKWIPHVPILQKLNKFEQSTGIEFTHIRLLARAMTHRSLGYNNLTMGSNQRLEFLGDTVLQLVASEYLYKYFPEHHEGHLSLLRSSLVNNRTQSVVCDDLGMVEYAIYPFSKVELKAKDRADLLEAFLGALYVDKDLGYCTKFCEVCFFPRLQDFIMNQEWNDPKSKLQQCCLTLRTMDGGEPDIPVYKVIECKGPTNTRVYSVAVYFRRRRLAVGSGHSIQQAEMSAAENALDASKDLFPQLDHQRRAIEKSLNQRKPSKRERRK